MPFPMTHLCVAKKVADLNPSLIDKINKADNLPQYYLGSLSPDSVHFRENFMPEHKKTSHLCVGDERWGEITNNGEWSNNILRFALKHKDTENAAFVYGHCVHALTDLLNNIDLWTPFKLKHFNSTKLPDYENLYTSDDSNIIKIAHTKNFNLDIQLYNLSDHKDEIWQYLSSSKGVDINDISIANELNKIKDNILYSQFKDKPIVDFINEDYLLYENLLDFIDRAAKFICDKFNSL